MVSKEESTESELTFKSHSYLKEVVLIKLPGNGNLESSYAHVCSSSVAAIKMKKMQPCLDWKC